jgi:hypothetical protein
VASADSRRLALHALERLSAWPDTLRLEVREGSGAGALLDSIGDKHAPRKTTLVKNGPHYQALDERGKVVDSVPRQGDDFYRSILYALPDDVLSGLGLAKNQDAQLQRRIIDYADLHRKDMPQLLEPRARHFKPPVRVSATLKGYYASGRGKGMHPSIQARGSSGKSIRSCKRASVNGSRSMARFNNGWTRHRAARPMLTNSGLPKRSGIAGAIVR